MNFQELHYSAEKSMQGLVGAWFGNSDLTNCKDADLIKTLEQVWDEESGHGREWSAKWEGFLVAPASGEINFHAETNRSITLEVEGKQIIQVQDGQTETSGSIAMVKDKKYPITVIYSHDGGFDGYFRVKWNWVGQDKTSIPAENLRHTAQLADYWGLEPTDISDISPIDRSAFMTIPVQNVIVYYEPGRFAGWPANNGVWSWGDEILVGFHAGYYESSEDSHSIARDKPHRKLVARSLDGGETWNIEEPQNFDEGDGEAAPLQVNIDFAHPDFAMQCSGAEFRISYNRGKTWQSTYKLPGKRLTSRTDYIVNGPTECLFFLSAKDERVEANLQDRAFCVRTTDGGKTINFLSWMTHDTSVRSVMPSTVRISENQLVSAMRRKKTFQRSDRPDITQNWIDIYVSNDNGQSWKFLSKVADTDKGRRNGNPPSMVRLKDGRLCVTYGYRSLPYGIRAKLSEDNGKTWGEEIHLRDDGRTWDFGYTRTVQRSDGKLVTIYYYTTKEHPEQHIAATIWDAD